MTLLWYDQTGQHQQWEMQRVGPNLKVTLPSSISAERCTQNCSTELLRLLSGDEKIKSDTFSYNDDARPNKSWFTIS
jgi:hypothetical protein